MTISRRSLLAVVISAAFAPVGEAHTAFLRSHDQLTRNLEQIFCHDVLYAQEIGLEYLRAFSAEADRAVLLASLDPHGMLSSLETPALRAWLRRLIRSDFEQMRVVELRGWILSVTEARVCALMSVT